MKNTSLYRRSTNGALGMCLICLLAVSSACVEPEPLADTLSTSAERAFTSGVIAKANLDGQLDGRRHYVELRGYPAPAVSEYVELLLSRTQFFGTFEDFGSASGAIASIRGSNSVSALTAAKLAAATHRFGDAQTLLAETEGGGLHDTILLALGEDLIGVAERASRKAEAYPTFENQVSLGAARAALGQFQQADDAMVDAIASYRDVSPLPIAWVQFQRGVMWAERADNPEVGRKLYRDAVRLLPGYVVATVHLAELEWEAGDVDGAVRLLRGVALITSDPEPSGLLGEILIASGKVDEGLVFVAHAASKYDALLREYPEAFADHAAEFFSGPGEDTDRAWALAEANLQRRGDARAFLLGLDIALTTGRLDEACGIYRRARGRVVVQGSLPLQQRLDDAELVCAGV